MTSSVAPRPLLDGVLAPGISWGRTWHHLRDGILTILIVSAIVLAGEYLGWFEQYEKGATDWLARQRSFESISREIVVVGIGEGDYETTFDSKSPLAPDKLKKIIETLAEACPAVIGIDIVDGPLLELQPTVHCKIPPRLIYAATAQHIDVAQGRVAGLWQWFRGGEMPEIEMEAPPPAGSSASGLPVFPMERDGMVRSYARMVRAVFPAPREPSDMRSMNAALVKGYCEAIKERGIKAPEKPDGCRGYEAGPETFLFGRWGQNHIVPLDAAEVSRTEFGLASASLKDKMVLLGGKFSASRDSYATPNGTYYGVDLLALAADSDLHNYGISEVEPWLALIWDLAIGASIVVLFAVFRPVPAFWISTAVIFFLSVGFSAFLFHVRSYALNFMVVGIGIIIHQLFEELKHLKDLDKAKGKIKALETELERLRAGTS